MVSIRVKRKQFTLLHNAAYLGISADKITSFGYARSLGRRWQENCIESWWEERAMLNWVWMFLILAIVAAIFGFTGVVAAAAGIAKILFFVFLVVFVIGLLMGRRVVS